MIKSFKCKETERIFLGNKSKKFPHDIQKRAFSKLHSLDLAENVIDLKNPPSNHLESLQGNRKNQFSIRVNNQYRICFYWIENNAEEVEIIDYH